MSMRPIVAPHDPAWADAFQRESQQVALALSDSLQRIDHIGSTAIPGIYAKPIIDMLGEAADLAMIDERAAALIKLGYESLGEYGIPGRRYFRKEDANRVRTHHLHIFASGDPQIARHLDFRDYLRAHPDDAQRYSDVKRQLMETCGGDMDRYIDGKDAFIQEIDRKAKAWRERA